MAASHKCEVFWSPTAGADLGILVGGGLTLFATPIIYLQHLFSKFHYRLGSPWGGGNPPPDPPLNCNRRHISTVRCFMICMPVIERLSLLTAHVGQDGVKGHLCGLSVRSDQV